ncbi:hypothetical protein A0H81_02274 [Grifola frondosa]|uniref:Hydrophobin n=1 Tax=Grifola frondosa TaxID=5627 RepID=A0A1C7ML78_GRIFR|nr:hypothetical protein A0H81_02274 [Grifola frondosa]
MEFWYLLGRGRASTTICDIMFAKFALLVTTYLPLFAAAQSTNCSILSTDLLCCDQLLSCTGTNVGLNCTSIDLLGILTGGCLTGTLTCCDNNSFGGAVALECTAATLLPTAVLDVLGSSNRVQDTDQH